MAGRRCSARDAVASMGWWGLVILAIAGSCRCGVCAAESAAIPQPSAAPSVAHAEEGGHCYRPLSDVIWGFLVTLLGSTVSVWGSLKHGGTGNKITAILAGVLVPFTELGFIIANSLRCVSILWNCHKMEHPDSRITSPSWLKFLYSSLYPWSKSPVRILASCDIVVYVSKESPLLEKKWLWRQKCQVEDESEAMVVGENGARRLRDHQYERKELSAEGIGLLVWKEVFFKPEDFKRLPQYDELKYLRGNSGFAIIAVLVQGIGYIYAVGFRMAKDLRISPLEVIGLALNIISLIKVFFYSTCNLCHRPLVIYMDGDWEHEVGEFNDNNQEKFELDALNEVFNVIYFGISIVLSTLLIYCIVNVVKTTNIMVEIPIMSFLVGLLLGLFAILVTQKYFNVGCGIVIVGVLLTAMAYIWALVGTMSYWKTMHFNTRGDLINLSQIIPFIG